MVRTTEQGLIVTTDNGQIARRNKEAQVVELFPPPYINRTVEIKGKMWYKRIWQIKSNNCIFEV